MINYEFDTDTLFFLRARTMTQVRKNHTNVHFKDFDGKHWVSDPGAYPVMGIVVFAVSFCTWKIGHAATSHDVRVMPEKRQNLIRPRVD